ncbi:hypothetical protein HMPREF9554_00891 [Treponema phagedenis F0421]|nr:hypothetical protein HMPREF9554_00891 [Treponema phagedenis F0421]
MQFFGRHDLNGTCKKFYQKESDTAQRCYFAIRIKIPPISLKSTWKKFVLLKHRFCLEPAHIPRQFWLLFFSPSAVVLSSIHPREYKKIFL